MVELDLIRINEFPPFSKVLCVLVIFDENTKNLGKRRDFPRFFAFSVVGNHFL
jgi:hypothetical protein